MTDALAAHESTLAELAQLTDKWIAPLVCNDEFDDEDYFFYADDYDDYDATADNDEQQQQQQQWHHISDTERDDNTDAKTTTAGLLESDDTDAHDTAGDQAGIM